MFADVGILSTLIFLPLLGGIILLFLPENDGVTESEEGVSQNSSTGLFSNLATLFALLTTLLTFVLSLMLVCDFTPSNTNYQFVEQASWIPAFGVQYLLGIDGISVLLVLLTTFLMPIIVLVSNSVKRSRKAYLFHMLALETAMLGTLLALDVFLFYVFWELMLAPMYFIIGIWGGKRKVYATLKFVLYTVFGSVLMLVGIFYVVWAYAAQNGGEVTFVLSELVAGTSLGVNEQTWLFLAFLLAFGIKVPLFPFHTWLPDAHVEAPTGGSIVLAGVLLKMGLYGFIRFAYPLFPIGAYIFGPLLAILAVIGIVYGALVAWAQHDIKKLVAYSSVSHLGYCVLGFVALNTMATTGSIYQMLNHGISTGALFLLVGVLYDRKHTREISDYGGLASKVPVFAFLFLVFTLSSIALPLTNGFIGEFMILAGSYQKYPVLTIVALSGVVLGAVYMLTLYMRTMFGDLDEEKNGDLEDVNSRELIALAPLFVMVFVMGIFPKPFLDIMEPTVSSYVKTMNVKIDDYGSHKAPAKKLALLTKNASGNIDTLQVDKGVEISKDLVNKMADSEEKH